MGISLKGNNLLHEQLLKEAPNLTKCIQTHLFPANPSISEAIEQICFKMHICAYPDHQQTTAFASVSEKNVNI